VTRSAGSAKNFGHQLAAVLEIAERWGPVDVSHRKPLTAVPTRVSCASPRRRSGVLSSLTAWSCPTHRFAREKWVKAIVEWIETFFGHIKHEWP
jgi:hypothetical protein